MKKRRNLLLWAGIVNFICAAFFLYALVAITYNIQGILDMVKQIIQEVYPTLMENYLSLMKTYLIIAIIADIIFGVTYIIYSRYSDAKFFKTKVSLTVFTLINILIGMNLISFILIMIALFMQVRVIEPEQQSFSTSNPDNFYNIAEQISILKGKLATGEITEEQYKELLNKLIGNTVDK